MKEALRVVTILCALSLALRAAGEPLSHDPVTAVAPPAQANGYPSRDPTLDVLPGFQNPPPGYGQGRPPLRRCLP